MTCAACLREMASASRQSGLKPQLWRRPATAILRAVALGFGVLTACVFFHLLGRVLLASPDEFHAGTLWEMVSGGSE